MPCFDEDDLESLPWPLVTIDFEASALDPRSYPIEVGICRWRSPASPLETWSTSISPNADWTSQGVWSMASEAVHGISEDELVNHGRSATEAVATLNTLVGEGVCYCDGGDFDQDWARKMSAASDVRPTFKLGNWSILLRRLDVITLHSVSHMMHFAPVPHRAGPDAERLMSALAKGLGLKPGLAPLTA